LYSLSKLYDMEIDEIMINNPFLKEEGLKVGQLINFPANDLNVKGIQTQEYKTLKSHHVEKGETLYSLSKMYDIEIDEIKELNPIVDQKGLFEGLVVVIEREKIEVIERQATVLGENESLIDSLLDIEDDSSVIQGKNSLNIALFAPLFLTLNEMKVKMDMQLYTASEPGLNLYAGVLLALDSLAEKGIDINLQVVDTENDSSKVEKIIQDFDFSSLDFIIGPLYQGMFSLVSKKATEYKIPIIRPVPVSQKMLLSSPYTFKAFPSKASQHAFIKAYICEKYPNEKLLVIDSKDKYKGFAKGLMQQYDKVSSKNVLPSDTAQYFSMWKIDVGRVSKNYSPLKKNVIVVLSDKKSFVTEVLTKLYLSSSSKDVIVFGEDKWSNFTFLDVNYLERLNVHIPKSQNLSDTTLLGLKLALKTKGGELDKYSISGYNSCMFLGELISSYSIHAMSYANSLFKGIGMNFNFAQKGEENGYENTHSYLFKYHNFQYSLLSVKQE